MRAPRDYDAELKILNNKARVLQERKLRQLGELVVATGADALPIEQLTGALLAANNATDMMTKEEWRARGAAFFFRKARRHVGSDTAASAGRAASDGGGKRPPNGGAGAK
jgi:hypothetical protein